MFVYEIHKALELLEVYKNSRVNNELYCYQWMEGEYQSLIPNILAEVIAAHRFVEYMSFAIRNDEYPNGIREMGREEGEFADSDFSIKLWEEYDSVFDDVTRPVVCHLIEQIQYFDIDRHGLRDGVWTEVDFCNYILLNQAMGTMCLLCDKVFESYYSKYGQCESIELQREEDYIDCSWLSQDKDSFLENGEIEFALANPEYEYDLYTWDDTDDLHPPMWVYSHKYDIDI